MRIFTHPRGAVRLGPQLLIYGPKKLDKCLQALCVYSMRVFACPCLFIVCRAQTRSNRIPPTQTGIGRLSGTQGATCDGASLIRRMRHTPVMGIRLRRTLRPVMHPTRRARPALPGSPFLSSAREAQLHALPPLDRLGYGLS